MKLAVTVSRLVLRPFLFSDGETSVPAGNVIAIPSRAIMVDPQKYDDPTNFDPYRFLSQNVCEGGATVTSSSRWSHLSLDFPFWGFGGASWYA